MNSGSASSHCTIGSRRYPAHTRFYQKDIVICCKCRIIKMIVCAGESVITDYITAAMPDPSEELSA